MNQIRTGTKLPSTRIRQAINIYFHVLQSYLVSIRPFLRPKAGSAGPSNDPSVASTSSVKASHLSAPGGGSDSKSLVTSAQNDEIFSHGREIEVDWRMASWITLRDQVSHISCFVIPAVHELINVSCHQLFSPLAQGVMWGFLTIAMGTLSSGLHVALYPKSHVASGRVTGGPRGKVGGGEVVGGTAKGGYWRGFVKSIFGGLETAAA